MKSKRNISWKISVFALLFAVLAVISIGCASADTIYVPDNHTTIQQAVNNASSGDIIIVRDGTHNENVDVNKSYLTIRSENGSVNCIVNAADSGDHVFNVTANYVNITGFTVENATGTDKAGIYLNSTQHCNISANNVMNNYFGIYLYSSSNNTLTDNNASSNNDYGIYLESSSSNTLINNTANSNTQHGILLYSSSNNNLTSNTVNSNTQHGISLESSSNNTLTSNTANSNTQHGICLWYSSNNNTLTENTANSNGCGIYLYSSSNNNTLTSNNASSNNYGIRLDSSNYNNLLSNNAYNNSYGIYPWSSSNNNLTENTANSNHYGVYLRSSSNNSISCNLVYNNTEAGFYLIDGSTGNTIERNNIVENGAYNGTSGGWEWNFYNDQSDNVSAKYNWWGTVVPSEIAASINEDTGSVDYSGYLDGPSPCAPGYRQPAPIPAPIPAPAFSVIGLLALIGILSIVLAVATLKRSENNK
ncbi:MAG: hypothetical protein AEth_00795 [Candidatus Argoarchaeum ethanivorans]|uniref:Carbohydrate-binding/sugar hydrolysis domain-containing protein n=1 Tax=Candidatus Argoarchaeum ethanivorans TaxID=2608793 RepID=A0A8B3S3M5_9EURY|nr:MAG: hypothetical protein AEth_00795 [Candidatus Argoarchaeum ethanivorans]